MIVEFLAEAENSIEPLRSVAGGVAISNPATARINASL